MKGKYIYIVVVRHFQLWEFTVIESENILNKSHCVCLLLTLSSIHVDRKSRQSNNGINIELNGMEKVKAM